MKRILALTLITVLFVECSTVPITGRKRINFVNDSQVLPTSFQQYRGFLTENKAFVNTLRELLFRPNLKIRVKRKRRNIRKKRPSSLMN